MARRFALLVIMAGAVLLVCSAVAFAAVRTGNEGDNTLMGTRYKDSITGKGGDDRTVGKGGNDTYFYADGWGHDTVVDSGGTDTLNFSAVTGGVSVHLCSPVGASDSLSRRAFLLACGSRRRHVVGPRRQYGHVHVQDRERQGQPGQRYDRRLWRQEHALGRWLPAGA